MSRAEAGCARPRKGVSRLDSNGRTEKDHKMNVEVSQKIAEVLAAARQRHEKLSPRQELKRRAEQALKAAKYRGASPESRKRYDLEKTLEDRATKALSEAVARASCTADAQPQPTQLSGAPGLRAPPHSVPWGAGHRYEADSHLPWLQEETEMTEDATAWNMEIDHGHSGHAIEDYAGYDAWAEGNDPMVDGYADGMAATWDVQETSSWAGQGSSFFAHGAFPHGAVQGYMAMDEQPSRWTSKPPLRARSEIFGPVGCIIVAQIIATVVREQERKHALDIRHEENQAFVKRALENLNVPIELQRRVFSLHYFQKMSHDYEAFEHLFKNHTLSSPLEDAIRVYLYQSVLTSGFFSNKEHSYILAVVRVLEDKAFLPGDYVVRVGEVADEMYFISKGEVSVLVSNGKSKEVEDAITLPIRKRKGDHFGEVALIKGSLRTAWVKAETYVVASCLKRSSIEQIWKYFPHERETLQREVMKTVMRDAARVATARRSVIGAVVPDSAVPTGLGAAPKEAHGAQVEALQECATEALARIERFCESITTRQEEMMNRLEDLETRLPEKPKKGGTKEPEARTPQATASASTKKSLKPGAKKKSTRPEVEDEVSPGTAASEIGRPFMERPEA